MDSQVRQWIDQILEEHPKILKLALRQRAKFEGWLKFELAVQAKLYGAVDVEVESASPQNETDLSQSDIAFTYV